MPFRFSLSQRVNVPHATGLQGLVRERSERVGQENNYLVAFLQPDGSEGRAYFDEAVLSAAQTTDPNRKK